MVTWWIVFFSQSAILQRVNGEVMLHQVNRLLTHPSPQDHQVYKFKPKTTHGGNELDHSEIHAWLKQFDHEQNRMTAYKIREIRFGLFNDTCMTCSQ